MANLSLDNTLGAFSIGATLANILFGITTLQSALYYKNYPNDGRFYKASVGIIWILDTLDVAVTAHASYFYAIKNFGNIKALTEHDIVWSFKLHILICVVVRVFVQTVYALRLWKLGQYIHQSILWSIILVTTSNAGARSLLAPSLNRVLINTTPGQLAVYILSNLCRNSGLSRYSIIIDSDTLNSYSVSNFSETPTIKFLLWPDTLIFLGVDCLQPKLFINSLLAMLNAWKAFRNIENSFRLRTINSTGLTSEGVRDHRGKDKQAIIVSMEIESETV
ncbi:uncharacterized protein EV420DRAFT_1634825 [Desarmillaria tabescens]|uniref:Uncharacterized protein n=1 Tax=Armillaria tabescens TaxID=1929756 RepID=A0AA39NRL7_ARMTA|nr:uncharacterized protein EV420DRAFT_1634825 [Desarmillaria tabescens]KAK0470405.1 hypothetical protein EV420DRAFT_1634825 [Desarmillaria tabescens]